MRAYKLTLIPATPLTPDETEAQSCTMHLTSMPTMHTRPCSQSPCLYLSSAKQEHKAKSCHDGRSPCVPRCLLCHPSLLEHPLPEAGMLQATLQVAPGRNHESCSGQRIQPTSQGRPAMTRFSHPSMPSTRPSRLGLTNLLLKLAFELSRQYIP